MGGVVACALGVGIRLSYVVVSWWITGATPSDRDFDLGSLREEMLFLVVGCATIGSCSGWLAFASREKPRIAHSLWLVFLGFYILCWLVKSLEILPPHLKGEPGVYLPGLIVLVGVPILWTSVLTLWRVRLTRDAMRKS